MARLRRPLANAKGENPLRGWRRLPPVLARNVEAHGARPVLPNDLRNRSLLRYSLGRRIPSCRGSDSGRGNSNKRRRGRHSRAFSPTEYNRDHRVCSVNARGNGGLLRGGLGRPRPGSVIPCLLPFKSGCAVPVQGAANGAGLGFFLGCIQTLGQSLNHYGGN